MTYFLFAFLRHITVFIAGKLPTILWLSTQIHLMFYIFVHISMIFSNFDDKSEELCFVMYYN